jgi:hypothetical protein
MRSSWAILEIGKAKTVCVEDGVLCFYLHLISTRMDGYGMQKGVFIGCVCTLSPCDITPLSTALTIENHIFIILLLLVVLTWHSLTQWIVCSKANLRDCH